MAARLLLGCGEFQDVTPVHNYPGSGRYLATKARHYAYIAMVKNLDSDAVDAYCQARLSR